MRFDPADDALRALGDAPAAPPMSAELEAVLARARPVATRRPVRDAALIAAVSLLYAAVLVVATTVRRDFSHLPVAWRVWYGAAWLAGFGLLLALVVLPRAGQVTHRVRAAGTVGLAAASLLIGLGLAFAEHAPGVSIMPAADLASVVRAAWPCWTLGLLTALVPVALGLRALRGAVPVGARWVGFGLGAAGGALGGLVLHLHCPIAQSWHVGIAHGGAALLAGLAAALAAPSQLEP